VVLIDTIFEELIQVAAQHRNIAPRAPDTKQSGSRIVFEEDLTGLIRLTLNWRASPSACSTSPCQRKGSDAAPKTCAADAHEGRREAECRQCREAASFVPLPSSNDLGLGVIDLLASFSGWLSLLTGTQHMEEHDGKDMDEKDVSVNIQRAGATEGNVGVDYAQKSRFPTPRVIVLGRLSALDAAASNGAVSDAAARDAQAELATTTSVPVLPRAHVAVFSDLHWDHEVIRYHSHASANLDEIIEMSSACVYALCSERKRERERERGRQSTSKREGESVRVYRVRAHTRLFFSLGGCVREKESERKKIECVCFLCEATTTPFTQI